MADKPYLPQPYFALSDQWSSRVIVDHAGRPALRCTITPAALKFGIIRMGSISTVQTVTLTNVGYVPVMVSEIDLVGDFVVSHDMPPTGIIPVDGVVTFEVQFKPLRVGIATGGLYIDTNVSKVREFIPLLGSGQASDSANASFSVTTLDFSNVTINTTSASKTVVITNTGEEDLTISAISVSGQFAATLSTPVTLSTGGTATIVVTFKPTSVGAKTGTLTVTHDGDGDISVALSGTGVTASTKPTISISNAVIEAVTENAKVSASATSLSFSDTTVGSSSAALSLVLTNSGGKDASITGLTLSDPQFTFGTGAAVGTTIPSGGSVNVRVLMTPASAGEISGILGITTDAKTGSAFSVSLSGSGVAKKETLDRISISGNQFVNESGKAVRLISTNWFGMEGTNYTPHGTWTIPWKNIIDDIASMGFNCIRFPFSGDTTTAGRTPPTTAIDKEANPDLVGLSSLAILDLYIDYCKTKGIYVVLDHHRRTAGDGADGSPVDGSYTTADWYNSWGIMASRYADDTTVIGADLHNEPHNLSWADWNSYATGCAEHILTLAPKWIFFVEGVGTNSDNTSTWWGGALKDVATNPVTLSVANKVAYSPHEYGQSVGSQQWLSTDSNPVSGYPSNLYAVWDSMWGFIFKNNIAPIWIGEFGGKFGVDGSGNTGVANGTVEKQWVQTLITYLNGDFNGNGTNDLAAGKKGLSCAYWGYNPNSADTGGLVQDDWVTHQTVKLDLLANLFG